MKLAPLLSLYLIQAKKLNLAGIGRFSVTTSRAAESDPKNLSQHINFESDPGTREDEGLIGFISANTGKMKALASSDLNSYLDLAKEFLNIGKPFFIEGIGTLVKKRGGQFEFTADHILSEKVKETGIKELSATSTSDESFTTYENLKPKVEKSSPYKKLFLIFLVLATVIAVIWGGYKLSRSKSSAPEQNTSETVVLPDTTRQAETVKDTVSNKEMIAAGNYRFVIEVANKERALQRYAQLKGFGKSVQLSTADSSTFKLFFVLPATPADTSRIADSLTALYPAINRRKAFAEN